MTTLLFVFIYVALATSLVACIVRAVRYARLPLNLRWELYPVAGRDGSYFQDLDWWTNPTQSNRLGEIKVMGAEILFLHAMYRHNRKLWKWSYPFHLGLYLLIAAGAAALAGFAIAPFAAIPGCILVMAGTAGLLVHRINDPELRNYSAPMDYFNLCFFFVTTAALLILRITAGGPGLVEIVGALLTFNTSLVVPVPQAITMAVAAVLIAYIPMTHMAHFIGKYFMWHAIRWGDQPSSQDQAAGARLAGYLAYKPSWSAPHIGADGARPWSEIVTQSPAMEKTK